MKIHRALLGAFVVAGVAATPAAFARVNLSIEIGVPPPAARVEVVPASRAGYVWAPGYWGWNGHMWVWIQGRWLLSQPGYHWQHEHWVRAGNRWRFVQGDWVRDKREYRRDRGRDRHRDRRRRD